MIMQSFTVAYGASVLEFHLDTDKSRYVAAVIHEDERGLRTCSAAYECEAVDSYNMGAVPPGETPVPVVVPDLPLINELSLDALPEIVQGWLSAGADR